MFRVFIVCRSCRKKNPDTNIPKTLALCTMNILPNICVVHLIVLPKTNYQSQKVTIKHGLRAVKNPICFVDISSRVIDFIRYCLCLSFPLFK